MMIKNYVCLFLKKYKIYKIIKFLLKPFYRFYMSIKNLNNNLYRSWIRNLDGDLGFKLRYKYYKKRLRFLGKNAVIDTGVYITGEEYISIGDCTHIDKNCILVASPSDLDLSFRYVKSRQNPTYKYKKGEIFIGKECHISQNTMIYGYGGVLIGNNSVMSAGAKIYSLTSIAYNPFDRSEIVSIVPYEGKSPTLMGAVVLEDNVWVGLDVIVCPGVTLKKNSFAMSQSIVNSSFEENSYIGGNPAIYIRNRYDVD